VDEDSTSHDGEKRRTVKVISEIAHRAVEAEKAKKSLDSALRLGLVEVRGIGSNGLDDDDIDEWSQDSRTENGDEV
jgi:hypothetical protein